jgi:hypothetical protein
MAGMFDDLVPATGGDKRSSLSFADLIPRAKPKRSAIENATGAAANLNRGSGIGDELAAGFGVVEGLVAGRHRFGLDQPGNALANNAAMLRQAYENELSGQRQREDSFDAEQPNAAALARGVGMAGTAFVPGGASANAFANSSRAVNAVRGAATGGLTAAGYAAADRGTLAERAQAAAGAARNPLALALGAAGGAVAPAARRAPRAKISPNVVTLREKGVQLTPGQARGGVSRAVEDAATSLPIVGTAIQEARTAGVESFNRAAANEALATVGRKLPDNIAAGHDAVAYVERTLGDLYDNAIPGKTIIADEPFKAAIGERLSEIVQDMTPAARDRLAGILDQRLTSRFGEQGAVSGDVFQRISSELGTVRGRFSASQDADQRAIADAIGVVQEELRNAAGRQDPAFAAAKTAIDKGYALFKRQQGAAASLGAEGGVFTPAQYGGAVRRGDRSADKGASARGDALGQGLADAGRAVLPSKVPDSGTATRGAIAMGASAPGAIIAAGATGGPLAAIGTAAGYGATLGGLKVASKAYSPESIQAANAALDVRIGQQQQAAALAELKRLALSDPKVAQLYQEVSSRLSRLGGVAGSQNALAANANPAQ